MNTKLLKFKDFVQVLEKSAYQPKDKVALRQPFWDSYYDNISKTAPKGTKKDEIIRSQFGLDSDGTAERQIRLMFDKAGFPVDKIVYHKPGEVRDAKNLGSNDYASYEVTSKGQVYWVTNSTRETDEGGEQEVGKKDLTPAKLNLTNHIYKDVKSLLIDIEANVRNVNTLSDSTKDFLIHLANQVSVGTKSRFKDMESFFNKGKFEELINIDESYDLDQKSLNNVTNDFGEVLDGVFILSSIQHFKDGLEFPAGENEALSDMWVDGWNVSSKAETGGGRPSIDALVTIAAMHEASGEDLDLSTPEQQEFYHLLLELSKLKGAKRTLPTVETYTFLAQAFLNNGKLDRTNSGFGSFVQEFKVPLAINPVHRKTIYNDLHTLAKKDPKAYEDFMQRFWTNCGSKPNQPMNAQEFLKKGKGDEFFYPLAVEVVKVLNNHYQDAILTIVNKLLVVKQMYLSIDLSKKSIKFTATSSDTVSKVVFAARGSSKTFNAGLGYEMKK